MSFGNLQSERFCAFRSGESGYAVPALSIQCVTLSPTLTKVPHSDPVLRGVCHAQNEFVPVFSLLGLMQIQHEQRNDAELQMLVVHGPAGNWGLLIDEALGLTELEISISALSFKEDAWSKISMGSASFKNQVLQILDPLAVYQYAIRLLDAFWLDQEKAVHSLAAEIASA